MLLQWSLGGFASSSGVMLRALVSPLAALVLAPRPLPWFVAYLALTAVSGLLETFLSRATIPSTVNVLFFVLNVVGVCVVVYFLLRYFTQGLDAERQKSETLLLNVLPASIARRLKEGEHPLADRCEEATVLFADLVGFTPMSERLSPEAVVDLLDEPFSQFDAMAERHGLEKIKTVGDADVVVGGVPEPASEAAEEVADMALEMAALVAARGDPGVGNLSPSDATCIPTAQQSSPFPTTGAVGCQREGTDCSLHPDRACTRACGTRRTPVRIGYLRANQSGHLLALSRPFTYQYDRHRII